MRIIALTMGQKEDAFTIAIDFDGVIHKYSKGWQDGSIYDDAVEGTEQALVSLLDKQYNLFIFTARSDLKAVSVWLKENFKDERIASLKVTNEKLPAQIYIDDRGYRFQDWEKSLQFIKDL